MQSRSWSSSFSTLKKSNEDKSCILGLVQWEDWGFPSSSAGKESACNVGDLGSISGVGRSSGGGHGNPLQYSCLENPHGQRSMEGYSLWDGKEVIKGVSVLSFPGGVSGKEPACQCRRCKRHGFDP